MLTKLICRMLILSSSLSIISVASATYCQDEISSKEPVAVGTICFISDCTTPDKTKWISIQNKRAIHPEANCSLKSGGSQGGWYCRGKWSNTTGLTKEQQKKGGVLCTDKPVVH